MDEIDEFLGKVMRGEDTTSDDISVPIGVVKNEYVMPREPKFYSNESLTLPINSVNVAKLRVPSGEKITYEVQEDGIYENRDTIDQDGFSMYGTCKMIISKEAFIAAYNAYIKDDK